MTPRLPKTRHWLCACLLAVTIALCPYAFSADPDPTPGQKEQSAQAPETKPAKVKVSGLGLWSNIETTRSLERILGKTRGPTLGINEIEDSAFLLISQQIEKGYRYPKLEIAITPATSGTDTTKAEPLIFTTNETLDFALPRDVAAAKVRFTLKRGERYKLKEVSFTGLSSIPEDEARSFFLPATSLVSAAGAPFSNANLRKSVSALQDSLRQLGYSNASVTVPGLHIDDATGRVTAEIAVNEGPRWEITSISISEQSSTTPTAAGNDTALQPVLEKLKQDFLTKPWSQWTQQDISEQVRQHYFRAGHPDVQVQIAAGLDENAPMTDSAKGIRPIAVRITANPGPEVRLGQVFFKGTPHTHTSILQRRVPRQSGDLLNPLVFENARYRLSSLGVFRSVDVNFAPSTDPNDKPVPADSATSASTAPTPQVRDATFTFRESPQTNASLLLGYGSYEQLRGGIEVRRLNTFGIADQTRLQFVQSMKSSSGDLTFGVPDLFARNIGGSIRAFGLLREEIAFDREEYGGGVTLRKLYRRSKYEVSAGYTYESLNNANDTLSPDAGDTDRTIAAAINLSLARDKRDNPLSPRHGYNWYLQAELASHYFGGQADYQRYRAAFNYHTNWGASRFIHVGLSHNVILPLDSDESQLPVNKLFYPGGENNIRGYKDGEAAPRDANGDFLGAKTYTLLNLELEQAVTETWSVVLFYDLMGDTADLSKYPANEWLNSIGIGIRYRTILGPLRLEYGRNLNPREGDPKGTLHFSVGIPF